MKSFNAYTHELDNIDKAADELYTQIMKGFKLEKNTVGILLSDYDIDNVSLVKKLNGKFDFNIIGSSTVGVIDKTRGYDECCIYLTVLTSESCSFHVEISGPINNKNISNEVESCYLRGEKALGERAKMIFAIPCFKEEIPIDNYIEALSLASFNLPIFGGMPSGELGKKGTLSANGNIYDDRLAILLISGDIHPVFVSDYSLINVAEQKRTITKSKDNIIYTLGDITFIDYMKNIGLSLNYNCDEKNTMNFIAAPLLIEGTRDGEKHHCLRTVIAVDKETGGGISLGKIEEGTVANVGFLRRKDVALSFSDAIDELLCKIENNEKQYACKYSTILCASCFSRYFVMSPDYSIEGDIVKERLKNKEINFTGLYSFGEIFPHNSNGYYINTYNDGGVCLCAF